MKTIRKIHPRVKQVITGLGVGAHLEKWGVDPSKIREFDWYDSHVFSDGFELHATPARHFSGRGFKRNTTLWTSFVLKTPTAKVFIGGDGGYDTHFAEIGNKFGPFDLVILEAGQYDRRWKHIHLMPDEVIKAAIDLQAHRLLPVHNSKFALAAHPWDEPRNKVVEHHQLAKPDYHLLTPIIGEKVGL